MTIPVATLNTLYAFATKQGLQPQDMSFHQDKMTQHTSTDEWDKLMIRIERLKPVFFPRHNTIRWFEVNDELAKIYMPLRVSSRTKPSLLLCFRGSIYHLEYTEISMPRLCSLEERTTCGICHENVKNKSDPAGIDCENCQAPTCLQPCTKERIEVARKDWFKVSERNQILKHFNCPICRHMSVKELARVHRCILDWEGIDFEEAQSYYWIRYLKLLYLQYQKNNKEQTQS